HQYYMIVTPMSRQQVCCIFSEMCSQKEQGNIIVWILMSFAFQLMAGIKPGNNTGNNMGSTLELWQAFFANPLDWRDYRKNKVLRLVNNLENACITVFLSVASQFSWLLTSYS